MKLRHHFFVRLQAKELSCTFSINLNVSATPGYRKTISSIITPPFLSLMFYCKNIIPDSIRCIDIFIIKLTMCLSFHLLRIG